MINTEEALSLSLGSWLTRALESLGGSRAPRGGLRCQAGQVKSSQVWDRLGPGAALTLSHASNGNNRSKQHVVWTTDGRCVGQPRRQ